MSNELKNVRIYGDLIDINGTTINKKLITSYELKKLKRGTIFLIISVIYAISFIGFLFSGNFEIGTGMGVIGIVILFGFLASYYSEAWKIKIFVGNKKYVYKAINEEEIKILTEIERAIRS